MTTDLLSSVAPGTGHQNCILCGEDNPLSLKLSFEEGEQRNVFTTFHGHHWLQGYSNILHGGIICALLDSAMTHCLFAHNIKAVTGEMKIRFLHPVPSQAKLRLSAQIDITMPPVYRVKGQIHHGETLMARSEAKFMQFSTISESLSTC